MSEAGLAVLTGTSTRATRNMVIDLGAAVAAWLRMRMGKASSPSRAGSRLFTMVWTLVMA